MYWSTSNENRIWQSQFDGSQAISFYIDDVHTIGTLSQQGYYNSIHVYDTMCLMTMQMI